MAPPLSSWPWANLGSFKYVLCGPLVAKAIGEWREGRLVGNWPLCLLVLFALRSVTYQLWHSCSSMLWITRRRRIVLDGLDFHQIDREWHWDNFLILQLLLASAAFVCRTPERLPLLHLKGAVTALAIHVAVSEPLFYLAHRCLHCGYLFSRYHSIHHSSAVPQPMTAGFGTPAEQLLVTAAMGLPVAAAFAVGQASWAVVFGYVLGFDFLRCTGYSNVEVLPARVFEAMPVLRYLIYSPTYLTVHHKEKNCNFCLFMPLFDLLGNTINQKTWELQKENSSGKKNERVPDFVFLAHVIDVVSSMHVPFMFRSVSSRPFAVYLLLIPLWPMAFSVMLAMWAKSKTFFLSFYTLRGRLHQTWVVPRYGFQYFLPFAREGINEQIELAILRADKMGVKVLSLAALNKNESLNGGGTLFVRKHPDLRVRVVHGNTLTAAVILNGIPKEVREVFLTGATSKLGRAIALYLCRKNIRVLMLTLSTERFLKIQREAAAEHQHQLVQVTKYQAAQNCKTWIVGKWLLPKEQRWAPAGTHFHQFVVPPIVGFRKDCTYGSLAAMRLPKDVQGLGCCEYTMERGVVHACHAGGVVHSLEGWTHHEVGAIEVDRIDVVWEAAMKHGLTPV